MIQPDLNFWSKQLFRVHFGATLYQTMFSSSPTITRSSAQHTNVFDNQSMPAENTRKTGFTIDAILGNRTSDVTAQLSHSHAATGRALTDVRRRRLLNATKSIRSARRQKRLESNVHQNAVTDDVINQGLLTKFATI